MNNSLSALEIPGIVSFTPGKGGLNKAVINAPRGSAEIYLHGASVTSFKPAGDEEVLWLSKNSFYEKAKPIRGGIPLIFPWFGPHPAGLGIHGFARTMEFDVIGTELNPEGSVTIKFELASDETTRKSFPHDFSIQYNITVGQYLDLEFIVNNEGKEAFTFEEGLHTYFAVDDVRQTEVHGLDGVTFIDKVEAGAPRKVQRGAIKFPGEVDWVYQNTGHTTSVWCAGKRIATIAKENSLSTVVWNPSSEKGESMPDIRDGQWPRFVCVEAVNNFDNRVTLAPGGKHAMRCVVLQG